MESNSLFFCLRGSVVAFCLIACFCMVPGKLLPGVDWLCLHPDPSRPQGWAVDERKTFLWGEASFREF